LLDNRVPAGLEKTTTIDIISRYYHEPNNTAPFMGHIK
jgi:hypothetical protein